ncbi:MAG: acyltransferase [Bacteroidales bacterium]|nr:acyltransferase [Bacteroidales bacterium]
MKYIRKEVAIRNVDFGENVTVVEPANLYDCKIGDNCFIGPFVEIQNGVVIGNNCKIQSHAFICELVEIGDNCFISHGAMFINYLFKNGKLSGGDKSLWVATKIGRNVIIGTNATILPVSIVDNVVIGAGAVVTKDIKQSGVYAGNPAKRIRNI